MKFKMINQILSFTLSLSTVAEPGSVSHRYINIGFICFDYEI